MQRSSRCCSRSDAGMPASTSGQGHRLALSTVLLHPCRARDSFQACKAQARLNLLYTMANVDTALALLLLSPVFHVTQPLFKPGRCSRQDTLYQGLSLLLPAAFKCAP